MVITASAGIRNILIMATMKMMTLPLAVGVLLLLTTEGTIILLGPSVLAAPDTRKAATITEAILRGITATILLNHLKDLLYDVFQIVIICSSNVA